MKTFVKQIKGIFEGRSPVWYYERDGYFMDSIAIDPEANINSTLLRPGNSIVPIVYQKFSSTNVNSLAMWLETTTKDQNIYAYLDNGKLIAYNTSFTESLIGTPTSGAGNGLNFYNNYLYTMTPTDLSRYGPLNNAPALVNTVWTGATLGSQTALTNTAYPGIRNMIYPNHAGHVHVDNKLYICDFKNGQGMIHFVKTTKVTDEGDTNDGSTYNALDLPFGYFPFAIASWGTDLAILASNIFASAGSGTALLHGKAALFIWDTISESFYRWIPIPAMLATAMKNLNGDLIIFGGQVDFGFSAFRYSGGDRVEPLEMFLEGSPPPAGAVDTYGNRVTFGGYGTYPTGWAGLWSLGYQHPTLPRDALNNIGRITNSSGTLPVVGAVKYAQQGQYIKRPMMSWRTDTTAAYGIDRTGGEVYNASFSSNVFTIGQPFTIKELRIPLGLMVQSGVTITPTLYFDTESSNTGSISLPLPVINTTNYPNSEREIVIRPPTLHAKHDFYLKLEFTGSINSPVLFPITIVGETHRD